MTERRARVTRSPMLAAMGVATLSGLTLRREEVKTTRIIRQPSSTLATHALPMLEAARTSMWLGLRSVPTAMAMRVARAATTSACAYRGGRAHAFQQSDRLTCMRERFPHVAYHLAFLPFSAPVLACEGVHVKCGDVCRLQLWTA